jgi:hypothetical protein
MSCQPKTRVPSAGYHTSTANDVSRKATSPSDAVLSHLNGLDHLLRCENVHNAAGAQKLSLVLTQAVTLRSTLTVRSDFYNHEMNRAEACCITTTVNGYRQAVDT